MSWKVYTSRQGKTAEELVVKEVTDKKYVVHNKSKNTVYIVDVVYTGKASWFSCFQFPTGFSHIEEIKAEIFSILIFQFPTGFSQ